jgi:hypothetical protein
LNCLFPREKPNNIRQLHRTMAVNQSLAVVAGGMDMEVPVPDASENAVMCAMLLRNIEAMEKRMLAAVEVSFNCLTCAAHTGCRLGILVGKAYGDWIASLPSISPMYRQ